MKLKRRNILRWMENRLRRLDYKISLATTRNPTDLKAIIDIPPKELERCHERRHRLANDIQHLWALNDNKAHGYR